MEDRCLLSISEFPVPTPSALPWSIASGSDGNLWFTERDGNKVGMINPTTHAITEFPIPTAGSWPIGITAGPDGNLWFTDDGNTTGNSYIGMMNLTTLAIAEFPVSPYTLDAWDGITSGPEGNLWFTDISGALGVINPTTHVITEYVVPAAASAPLGIAAGPDGNLWFADQLNGIGVDYMQNLVVTQQPSSVTAGSGFCLTVQAQDSAGNLISSFNGTVTVSLGNNPGGATLGGTLSVSASGGVASFSGLTLNKAASGYTLVATTSGLGQGVTSAMTVTPAAATQLVITQQPPATVKVNTGFGLNASIEDQYGNVVTSASNTANVAFANNPTGATLGGTRSVAESGGVVTFSNLTINKTGTGYTLQVSSSGLSSAVTNPIKVSSTGKTPIPLPAPAAIVPDSLLGPLVFDSPDLWYGLGPKKRSRLL
jgi:hypothetical protein